jgi:hypothetical protein
VVAFFDSTNYGKLRLNCDSNDEYPVTDHVVLVGRLGDVNNGNGAHLTKGGTWVSTSSRTVKENFQELNTAELLAKISALPITAWQYAGSDERHIGPVAEDFVAAFDVGTTRADGSRENQYISHGDVAGVALLAVKELEKKTRRIAELEGKVTRLEAMVQQLIKDEQ